MKNPDKLPALEAVAIPDDELDKTIELNVVTWESRLHCAYLNDFRIAGGKPWGGGSTAQTWKTTLREVIRAFPALQKVAGLNYLGRPTETPLADLNRANEIIAGLEAENARLREALRRLVGNAGALRAFKHEIIEIAGYTNWQCLVDAIGGADAALKEDER